jgi:hypothetical protein
MSEIVHEMQFVQVMVRAGASRDKLKDLLISWDGTPEDLLFLALDYANVIVDLWARETGTTREAVLEKIDGLLAEIEDWPDEP